MSEIALQERKWEAAVQTAALLICHRHHLRLTTACFDCRDTAKSIVRLCRALGDEDERLRRERSAKAREAKRVAAIRAKSKAL